MRLLHIEKDQTFSRYIKKIVEDNGFMYLNTEAYEDAVDIIDKLEINLLIITDVKGEDICEKVIHNIRRSGNQLLSIIVIAEDPDYDKKTSYFEKGIMSYLTKTPFIETRFEKYIQTVKRDLELIEELKSLKIAVVDDSSFSLSVIKNFFNVYGVSNVDYFQSSDEFMKNSKNYDIFLIDYVMPIFDGEELIYKIREENLDSMIILVTGYDSQKMIAHCLSIGADDFILKPLDIKLFMLRVISCLKQFKINKENQNKSRILFEMATKDSLTGAYNRNYFIDSFEKKSSEAARTGSPFSIILMDVDHFKSINDQYGHLKGDYVLKEIANTLKDNLRQSDIVCRWGGEEFIVLCLNTDSEKARIVAEKLRRAIEIKRFSEIYRITVSIGVTQWKAEDDRDSMLKRVDNSLYLAKLTGRNKVISDEGVDVIQDGKPINIEWGPFFRSGNSLLDLEHRALIGLINEIINNSITKDEDYICSALFDKLVEEVEVHFKREEELLGILKYDKLEKHRDIHKKLLLESVDIRDEFKNREISALDAARYMVSELVVGHIVKDDFDFFHLTNLK
ncbi:MAG: diguanylate cyclase [Proteocatella sp.]